MAKTIWVGMSGGVDSSAAAALLLEQGFRVTGVTLRLRPQGAEPDIEDARQVCRALGIEHRVLDFTGPFRRLVMDDFVREYLHGRTPNPCVRCNRAIKFGAMLDAALENGADGIATGHYARVERDPGSGRYLLYRTPSKKDQSYVLYGLTQRQLSHTLFPVTGLEKEAVREIARKYGLPVASKGDSMEICFVPDDCHPRFIEEYTGRALRPGNFVDEQGRVLGRHQGIARYTVGQRKGLGVAFGRPMYVVRIDAGSNEVVLGEEGRQLSSSLTAGEMNYIPFDPPVSPLRVQAKIRYQAPPADALLYPLGPDTARLEFDRPQRSVTPGQSVVLYDGDLVVGGGVIRLG
ncbi:MAG TPA: tRNA 2-thiouridine(34) synthase MnmA [Firmicutes bacterium]|nr:tRNA 2-thiouridine(34) synthase MnmA [Bacillota bacterium]